MLLQTLLILSCEQLVSRLCQPEQVHQVPDKICMNYFSYLMKNIIDFIREMLLVHRRDAFLNF